MSDEIPSRVTSDTRVIVLPSLVYTLEAEVFTRKNKDGEGCDEQEQQRYLPSTSREVERPRAREISTQGS